MCSDSMLRKYTARVRARAAGILLAVGSAVIVSLPPAAFAQTQPVCGPEIKEEVVKALAAGDGLPDAEKAALEAELYAKYEHRIIFDVESMIQSKMEDSQIHASSPSPSPSPFAGPVHFANAPRYGLSPCSIRCRPPWLTPSQHALSHIS
jgi:hypothetical protein